MERPQLANDVQSTIADLLTAAFGQIPPSAGVADDVLRAVEARLGIALPSNLRRFYSTTGRVRELMKSHHQFVDAESLAFQDEGAVFCREHRGDLYWALHRETFGAEDPPVVQGERGVPGWDEHCKSAAVFLINMSCWQLINAMPAMACVESETRIIRILRKQAAPVGVSFGFDMMSFCNPSLGLLATGLLNTGKIYFAARSDATLSALEKALGVELDWA